MIIRKLEEVRLNTHQTHMEDLVLFGEEGLDEINDKIERFKLKLQDKESGLNTTTKIDGAPSVFIWHKFEGLPDNSVSLKSFLGKDVKVISSKEDIENNYGNRPGMSKMLENCLELAKYIPSGEAWQGDCLFTNSSLKEREINGTDYITFQPNKIIYAFSENNPGYEDVKNAEFGIAFHTIYTGDVKNKSQNFNVKAEDLNAPSKFYILSPALNITNKQEFNLNEINNLQIKFNKEADNLKSDPAYNELINNKEFMSYWSTFENANLADKQATKINTNTFINDLKDYINDKLEKEYNKKLTTLKTDKGKEKALLNKNEAMVRLDTLVENNKQTLVNLVNCLNTVVDIKMLMWAGFKNNKTPYDTYYQSKSSGYIQADPEGIAMSDTEGNIVKIVDRSTFSSYNRNDDFISGFDHNESLDLWESFKLLEGSDKKSAVVAFGRLNPPTIGHKRLVTTIANKAKKVGAEPMLYLSHSSGNEKNPLSYGEKYKWVNNAFGNILTICNSEANTPYQVLHDLYEKGYTDVIYLSGNDNNLSARLMSTLVKYNNELNDKLRPQDYYKFNTLVTDDETLKRIEDENDPSFGASATKAREFVKEGNFEAFKDIVPFNEYDAKELFEELKERININEKLITEVLNIIYEKEESNSKEELIKKLNDIIDELSKEYEDDQTVYGTIESIKKLSSILNIKNLKPLKDKLDKCGLHDIGLTKFIDIYRPTSDDLNLLASGDGFNISDAETGGIDLRKYNKGEFSNYFIYNLVNLDVLKRAAKIGPYEIALSLLFNDGELSNSKGDVNIKGKAVEVKAFDSGAAIIGVDDPDNIIITRSFYNFIQERDNSIKTIKSTSYNWQIEKSELPKELQNIVGSIGEISFTELYNTVFIKVIENYSRRFDLLAACKQYKVWLYSKDDLSNINKMLSDFSVSLRVAHKVNIVFEINKLLKSR